MRNSAAEKILFILNKHERACKVNNHLTNSSAGSSIIKSCIELRDDIISFQYVL
ncbi:hypothetical protein WC5_00136 [Escherichia sp. KTE114]|nr:hypothetical protein WC5_00136 [Escherichia sp. KTE114]